MSALLCAIVGAVLGYGLCLWQHLPKHQVPRGLRILPSSPEMVWGSIRNQCSLKNQAFYIDRDCMIRVDWEPTEEVWHIYCDDALYLFQVLDDAAPDILEYVRRARILGEVDA